MSRTMYFPLLVGVLTMVLASSGVCAEPAGQSCDVDRTRLLNLDQPKFDQDMAGGWRALAARHGCELVAADLLRDYRQAHGSEESILYWHEGQLRAGAGQTEQAATLMERSRRPANDATGWNEYADATIAFLRKDRVAFDDAWRRLAAIPPIENVKDGYLEAHMADGSTRKLRWPINIDVVEGLAKCFDKPYNEASGAACRTPVR